MGFFIKKRIHKKYGLYNEKLDYCSDYDFIFRLVRNNLLFSCAKKNEVVGKFSKGGLSTKINILQKIFYRVESEDL